jgi:hypothetical protein
MLAMPVYGPQAIGLLGELLHLLVVVVAQHDAQLLGKAMEVDEGEKLRLFFAGGAEFQHVGEQLRRAAGSEGVHRKQLFDSLVVCELVRRLQPFFDASVRVVFWGRRDEVEHETETVLAERVYDVVVPYPLVEDALHPES